MEQEYAQALWESIERGMEPRKAVAALHESLNRNGRDALMPRIAVAFERLAQRENARNAIVLSIATEKDSSKAKREIESILKEMKADPKEVEVAIDPTLIGGWRLEGRGSLVEASHKQYLLDIYNRALSN